jgi:hypothetical protein
LPKDFPKEKLDYIENILDRDWSIFRIIPEKIKIVLLEICKEDYSANSPLFQEKVGIEKLCDSDFLKRSCLMKESTWEYFMSSIKNMNRFHSHHINLDMLKELFNSDSMKIHIFKNKGAFFRARICNGECFSKDQMGPPPVTFVTAGRVNAEGIRCLYLSSDVITTLHEIRARDLDDVSVAEFIPKYDLKVVDLSNLDNISPFSAGSFGCGWFAINMAILKKINKEIAKPLRRQDSVLDYLPAQYISDFIKSLGFDGICYKSTLNLTGRNYAIFDYKKFTCQNVNLYHVNSLDYNISPRID